MANFEKNLEEASKLEITRPQEEIQTFQRFIKNQGRKFIPQSAIQDESITKEPCDIFYNGIEYQITYGDREQLSTIRKITSIRKKNSNISETYFGMSHISEIDYAKELLKKTLEDKKDKSDDKMTLLVDCTYTSYNSLSEREVLCKAYFKNFEQRLGGSWQHIFIVFLDGNIQLR